MQLRAANLVGKTEGAFAFFTHSLLGGAALSVFLFAMLAGEANLTLGAALAIFGGSTVVVVSGEVLLQLTRLQTIPARLPVAIVVGVVATSIVLLLGILVTGLQAGIVFLGLAAVIALSVVVVAGRRPLKGGSKIDLAAVVAIAVLVGFWCRHAASTVSALKATGILPVWSDYFIHGAIIAQFGDQLAVGRGSIELAGEPLVFYHFAAYMIPAALAIGGDFPGLALATSIMLPLGLLVASLGSYALGTALADWRAGVVSIAFLLLLPDPSSYGLGNGFLGFHWLLFTAPGSGYALGAAAIALVFANEWFRNGSRASLVLALALTAAMFQLRAHIFLLFAPALVLTLVSGASFARRHASGILLGAFGVSIFGLALLFSVPSLHRFWFAWSAPDQFFHLLHNQEPMNYSGVYDRLVVSLGQDVAIPLGIALAVPALLGVFTIAYPIALIAWTRRSGWQPMDLFPLLLLFTFVACMLLAPAWPAGDVTELKQRGFVLVYQSVTIWTAAYLCRLVSTGHAAEPARAVMALVSLVVVAMLLGWTTGFEPARPKMAWGKTFYEIPIERGLIEAANYVRSSATRDDTVVVAPVDPAAALVDFAIEFTSLSGVPSYIARPAMHQVTELAHNAEVAAQRLARLKELEAAADSAQAFALLQRMCVTWYVEFGSEGPHFDPDRSRAAFAAGKAAVYRIPRATECNTR